MLGTYNCNVSKQAVTYKDKEKDRDKDKDAFIGPKEFVSHMMMTQRKDKLCMYAHMLKL